MIQSLVTHWWLHDRWSYLIHWRRSDRHGGSLRRLLSDLAWRWHHCLFLFFLPLLHLNWIKDLWSQILWGLHGLSGKWLSWLLRKRSSVLVRLNLRLLRQNWLLRLHLRSGPTSKLIWWRNSFGCFVIPEISDQSWIERARWSCFRLLRRRSWVLIECSWL